MHSDFIHTSKSCVDQADVSYPSTRRVCYRYPKEATVPNMSALDWDELVWFPTHLLFDKFGASIQTMFLPACTPRTTGRDC